ncbi:hypothetical protein EZV62_001700 [Acer yangbiense]|uniref:Pentatricopeptide repeat-containing protein n=1 Tax=Acer yangbiense TaxID=1000413 RepID=A0A5C7IV23_9ROSI|nr:hypothetical protein EZV62_001700 [Acer yangbiense]
MPQSSILLFTHLRKSTVLKPDKFTYSFTVSAASSWFDHGVGVLLHGQPIVDGYESDMFLGSALVDMYCRFSLVESARKVFHRIPVKDPVLYNTMISGLMKNSCFEDSIWVFWEMLKNGGNWLDSTSVAAVLPAVAELQELRLGMEIQCLGLKLGFHDHVYVLTGLVSLYSKCGEIEKAKLLFREINRPDLICCNAMISGYSCNGETESSPLR